MRLPSQYKTRTYQVQDRFHLYHSAPAGGPGHIGYDQNLGILKYIKSPFEAAASGVKSIVWDAPKKLIKGNPVGAFKEATGGAITTVFSPFTLFTPQKTSYTASMSPELTERAIKVRDNEFNQRLIRLQDLQFEAKNLMGSNDPDGIRKKIKSIRSEALKQKTFSDGTPEQRKALSDQWLLTNAAITAAAQHADAMVMRAQKNIQLQQDSMNRQYGIQQTQGSTPSWLPIVGIGGAALGAFLLLKG